MTKRIAIAILVVLFVAGVAYAADKGFGVGKSRNVTFNSDVKVGDKVLPAGEYKVLHLMEGNEHTLVFKSSQNNAEKVRVKCSMVSLEEKAPHTYSEFKTTGNERVLTALVFSGDTFKHTF